MITATCVRLLDVAHDAMSPLACRLGRTPIALVDMAQTQEQNVHFTGGQVGRR